jgi:hypothetical protein
MTAVLVPFSGRSHRAWVVRELRDGRWVGHRVQPRGDIIEQTEAGPEWRVAAIVNDYRQGLPIIRVPLRPSQHGGRAA